MSAVKVIRALLGAHQPVVALIGSRIYAGMVPEGSVYPVMHLKEVSRSERLTTSLAGASVLVTARVQVTAIARSYGECKALLQAAKLDAGAHTGIIDGVTVRSISRQSVGPDLYEEDVKTFEQSRDFMIVFTEEN